MSPRNKQIRTIGSPPVLKGYKPIGLPYNETTVIKVLYEEYEALRLADYSGLKQEEAAKFMNVSRPTFTRIYSSCLQKLAKAFAEGRSIVIEGGDVEFDKQWYRCNDCTTVFHHQDDEKDECISCESEDIEHINKSVRDWKEKQLSTRKSINLTEYCECPNCEYQEVHRPGIPCFTMTCPDCSTPLLRKDL
jgi:predicted DNA-binding protein (UPF0251 family)